MEKYIVLIELRLNGMHTTYFAGGCEVRNKKKAKRLSLEEANKIAEELTNASQEAYPIKI